MNQTIKRYLLSSLITFILGFLLVFVTEIDNITLYSLKDGLLVGIIFASARAGIKSVVEYIILILSKK